MAVSWKDAYEQMYGIGSTAPQYNVSEWNSQIGNTAGSVADPRLNAYRNVYDQTDEAFLSDWGNPMNTRILPLEYYNSGYTPLQGLETPFDRGLRLSKWSSMGDYANQWRPVAQAVKEHNAAKGTGNPLKNPLGMTFALAPLAVMGASGMLSGALGGAQTPWAGMAGAGETLGGGAAAGPWSSMAGAGFGMMGSDAASLAFAEQLAGLTPSAAGLSIGPMPSIGSAIPGLFDAATAGATLPGVAGGGGGFLSDLFGGVGSAVSKLGAGAKSLLGLGGGSAMADTGGGGGGWDWLKIAQIAAPIVSGFYSSGAAKDAADAGVAASNAAIASNERMFNTVMGLQAPWTKAGGEAVGQLWSATQDPSQFVRSPAYDFLLNEGNKNILRTAAARGDLDSGRTLREITQFGQDYAKTGYGDFLNNLARVAGLGQTSAQSVSNAGMNTANMTGNALMRSGDARASGYVGASNALTQGVQGAMNTMTMYDLLPKLMGKTAWT